MTVLDAPPGERRQGSKKLETLKVLPDWPARMTSDVACLFMGISEGSFLKRFGAVGVKEEGNRLWARAQLEAHIAKQFSLQHSPGRALPEEIDTWADL